MTITSGSKVIDLTELNTTEGSTGDYFMMFVGDVVKHNTTLITDPIRQRLLKKETAKGKLANGKRLTTSIHVCAEGHLIGQFMLDIIRTTADNKKKGGVR
jgi:hypothetical protein